MNLTLFRSVKFKVKVDAHLVTDANGSEAKRYWPNSYYSVIVMIFYMASNTRPFIPFDVHQCAWFTHNTKVSHDTAVKSICRYLQGTKDNCLWFNPSNELMVDCYANTDFSGMWGYEDPQNPICARSRTGFVVIFANCPLLCMSKIQADIVLYTLHSKYVSLSQSARELLPLKSLIKELIDNLGIDSEKMKCVSRSTIY